MLRLWHGVHGRTRYWQPAAARQTNTFISGQARPAHAPTRSKSDPKSPRSSSPLMPKNCFRPMGIQITTSRSGRTPAWRRYTMYRPTMRGCCVPPSAPMGARSLRLPVMRISSFGRFGKSPRQRRPQRTGGPRWPLVSGRVWGAGYSLIATLMHVSYVHGASKSSGMVPRRHSVEPIEPSDSRESLPYVPGEMLGMHQHLDERRIQLHCHSFRRGMTHLVLAGCYRTLLYAQRLFQAVEDLGGLHRKSVSRRPAYPLINTGPVGALLRSALK